MTQATITLAGEGIQSINELNVQISVVAKVHIDASKARRQATAWLINEVGNMLIGDTPQLVIGETTVWQVPALLTSPKRGVIGQVGTVEIDAMTGKANTCDTLKMHILKNVQQIANTTPAPN